MTEWVRIGSRFINLANVVEVHLNERPLLAQVFYAGGGSVDLQEDDAESLRTLLDERVVQIAEPHRRIIGPAS
ncbi:MAG TPA: hypothetical protein VMU89_18155 [Thermomicrobiaceae bacterium]|nr:hypothetical protein [Thermomicrobiaceae bacterium]